MSQAPERIAKYRVLRELGKGATGTVYLATDEFTGQDVALKVLDPELIADPEFGAVNRKQFLNEASLAGRLAHPHIANILEAAVDDASGYIAVEFVPGGTLARFMTGGLAEADIWQIAFKCCGALDYAYRQGIVHRDIKPANIMVSDAFDVKLTDFGAAWLYKGQRTQIADVGSPLYMSPEQISGRALTHHSDMFALGVVLYELFTGARPFSADSITDLFGKILAEQPPAPTRLKPSLSADIDRVVLRMLAKAPEDRYPGWAELALDIAEAGRLLVFQRGIPDSEKFVALRRIGLLAELADGEVWELVRAGRWMRVRPRSVVVREGELGQSLFLLASGEAAVTKQGRLLNVLRSGEYFGEMAYIKRVEAERHATVESISDVLLAEFEPAALDAVSKDSRLQLLVALMHTLVDRLALADARISQARVDSPGPGDAAAPQDDPAAPPAQA
jgi:tRNA A-37 threonylcarbamoyl transferase component Bud32